MGVGLIAVLVAGVVTACLTPAGIGVVSFVAGAVVALGLAVLLLLICGPDWCVIVGVLVWALRWAIVLGFIAVVALLSLAGLLTVLIMGIIVAGLIWWLVGNNCAVPTMLSLP